MSLCFSAISISSPQFKMRGFIRTLNKGGLTLQVASPITLQGLALTKAENAAIITVITLSFLYLGGFIYCSRLPLVTSIIRVDIRKQHFVK